jgi:hypothetical protein
MKKLLLITALAGLATVSAFGQGTVVFANDTTKLLTLPGGALVPRGTTTGPFLAELWAADDFVGGDQQLAFDLVATKIGNPAPFTGPPGQNGLFSGGTRTVAAIDPVGDVGLFQVRVWETAYGATYADAIRNPAAQGTGRAGQSIIFRSDTGGLPPAPAVPLATAFVPFQLSIIPEPSIIGLGLLGAGTLLLLRRRK